MRIRVIFTGGTIGSSVKKGFADVDPKMRYELLRRFQDDPDIEFDTSAPFSMLSENLSARELNLLQQELTAGLAGGYDGIIVTHGTDTLQYTAAAIELAFADAAIPIVLVSADYPLEDARSNGYINFEAAVEWIRSSPVGGVFVSYRNKNEKRVSIHIASHLLQHGENSADLYSIDGAPFAVYDGAIIWDGAKVPPSDPVGRVEYVSSPGILSVESCPGNCYAYSLDGVNAILLKPYHSGTLDTANSAFRDFCGRAAERGIPLLVSHASTGVSYKSTELYEDLGILPLPHGTYAAAYMRIWAAISLGKGVAEFVAADKAK